MGLWEVGWRHGVLAKREDMAVSEKTSGWSSDPDRPRMDFLDRIE
jgi:hypothetical protein